MTISNPMTIIGLVNGMIGGIILVLPILALHTGYILIAPITIMTGFISFFSCLLCLRHLKNYKDLDEAVLKHFNNNRKYQVAYDIIIAISMIVLLILYFTLICDQWIGITQQSILIPILNFIGLIPIIYIMKKFDFGASLLAYGILSIVGYVIFLIWMLITSQQGHEHVAATGQGFSNMTAGLSQGFAIQTFFIPVLKKNENRKQYKLFLIITYLIGTAIYLFIGYGGSFGIVNRVPNTDDPDTIEDYFPNKNWEVIFIQVVYLIHLYSVFPEFLFIAKKRIFNAFQFKNTSAEEGLSKKQILFYLVILLLCFGVQISGLRVTIIIELNGAIISFFFIYVIPISLHVKCVYFSKKEQTIELNQQKHVEMVEVNHKEEPKYDAAQFRQSGTAIINIQDMKDIQNHTKEENSSTPTNPSQTDTNTKESSECCDTEFYSKKHEKCQVILFVLMVTFGIFTMVHTLSNI